MRIQSDCFARRHSCTLPISLCRSRTCAPPSCGVVCKPKQTWRSAASQPTTRNPEFLAFGQFDLIAATACLVTTLVCQELCWLSPLSSAANCCRTRLIQCSNATWRPWDALEPLAGSGLPGIACQPGQAPGPDLAEQPPAIRSQHRSGDLGESERGCAATRLRLGLCAVSYPKNCGCP